MRELFGILLCTQFFVLIASQITWGATNWQYIMTLCLCVLALIAQNMEREPVAKTPCTKFPRYD